MRAVLTGASGYVGREMVPRLAAAGVELLLVGRDPGRLGALFPGHAVCGYDELSVRGAGFDVLLHLAVLNNDAKADGAAFEAVNVDLAERVAEMAATAGIGRFVYVSSTHALDEGRTTPYAASKREGVARLTRRFPDLVTTVYLPYVYGERWNGSLARLHALPGPVARAVFRCLAAVRPTVHVQKLADLVAAPGAMTGLREVVLADDQDDNPVYVWPKRGLDLLSATGVLVLMGWMVPFLVLAIRVGSPGPGLFAQERVGREGRPFTCYKFRSMKQGTVQVETSIVSASSVTGIGRFLRKTKLDELPQIWNIFRNEMSFVGPRPCLPSQTALVEARRVRGCLTIKPGITGLAQIKVIDMSVPERLARHDARYKALRSLALDVKIMIATATGSGRGDRVKQVPAPPPDHDT